MNHYLERRVCHKNKYPEEGHYELLLLMNDATLRVAFSVTLGQDTPSTPPQLTELVHIDEGSSGCVPNEGSSIPKSAVKGKVT